ncbi:MULTISPECIES: hypothetical protein [unclassified Acinetobacter]|uniref:hypothetical protein n=1 Tax=unclassified Acinetobacter TaxID=196816 RepID=UPI0015D1D16D|nr:MULTISPECIES: hypothetical protein [unclassified Acinetobacter]
MNRIPFPPNQSLQAFTQGFYAVGLHACMQSFHRFHPWVLAIIDDDAFLSAQRFCMGLSSDVNIIFLVYWLIFSGLFWLTLFLLLADLLCMIIFILLAR